MTDRLFRLDELRINARIAPRLADFFAKSGAGWDKSWKKAATWLIKGIGGGLIDKETEAKFDECIAKLEKIEKWVRAYEKWRGGKRAVNTDTIAGAVVWLEAVARMPREQVDQLKFDLKGKEITIGKMRTSKETALAFLDTQIGSRHLRKMLGSDAYGLKIQKIAQAAQTTQPGGPKAAAEKPADDASAPDPEPQAQTAQEDIRKVWGRMHKVLAT